MAGKVAKDDETKEYRARGKQHLLEDLIYSLILSKLSELSIEIAAYLGVRTHLWTILRVIRPSMWTFQTQRTVLPMSLLLAMVADARVSAFW